MALSFDSSSNSGYQASSASYSWSHTVSGVNTYLVVGVTIFSPTVTVTSVTFNSISLSQLYTVSDSGINNKFSIHVFGVQLPSNGTHNINVTLSTSSNSVSSGVSFSEVNQNDPTESTHHSSNVNFSINLSNSTVGDWIVAFNINEDDDSTTSNDLTPTGSGVRREYVEIASVGSVVVSTTGPINSLTTTTIGYSGFDSSRSALSTAMIIKPIVFNAFWAKNSNYIIQVMPT